MKSGRPTVNVDTGPMNFICEKPKLTIPSLPLSATRVNVSPFTSVTVCPMGTVASMVASVF